MDGAAPACCVRTAPLVKDPAFTDHWFHHAVQPAVTTAIALRLNASSSVVSKLVSRRACVVVAHPSLVRAVHASAMVRFLFEGILTQGRFNVSSYADHDEARNWPCLGVRGPQSNETHAVRLRSRKWVTSWAPELRRARAQFARACGIEPPRRGRGHNRSGAALLYLRNLNRHLDNPSDVRAALVRFFGGVGGVGAAAPRTIMHDPRVAPCAVVRAIARSRLLLTVHGFNSAVLLFMPPGAAFVEVFPQEYAWPDGAISHVAGAIGLRIGHLFAEEVPPRVLDAPWPAFLARAFRNLPRPSKLTDHLPLVAMLRRTAHRMHNVRVNATQLMQLLVALHGDPRRAASGRRQKAGVGWSLPSTPAAERRTRRRAHAFPRAAGAPQSIVQRPVDSATKAFVNLGVVFE